MRSVEMFNVGFGDCFILSEENDAILVDFGSKQNVKKIASNLSNQIRQNNIQRCLLTHFHDDHYKGINELAKINSMHGQFSEIILPNIYFSSITYKIKLAQLLFLSKNGVAWNEAYNYVTSIVNFKNLLNNNGTLTYVSAGSSFTIDRSTYKILSPDVATARNVSDTNYLNFLERLIRSDAEENETQVLNLINTIFLLRNRIAPFEENITFEFINTELRDACQDLLNLINELAQQKIAIPLNFKEAFNSFQFSHSRNWNKLSIVFQEENGAILMTGDMPKSIWHKIKNQVPRDLCIFKVPHHGTKKYFCFDFPIHARYLVSNGKCNGWDISALYPLYYHASDFFCTNNSGCEYFVGTCLNCNNARTCGCSADHSIIQAY